MNESHVTLIMFAFFCGTLGILYFGYKHNFENWKESHPQSRRLAILTCIGALLFFIAFIGSLIKNGI